MSVNKDNTIIMIDWDDTLFPTTWCIKNNININDQETRNKYVTFFSELDKIIYKILNKFSSYGKVIIVTNALLKWINITSDVLPHTKYILRKLKVISARQLHQLEYNMTEWKKKVFRKEIDDHEIGENLNVISIGDANYEYTALIELYHPNKKDLLKAVRLISAPSHNTLLDQLEVIYKSIPNICLTDSHLDLEFRFFSGYDT